MKKLLFLLISLSVSMLYAQHTDSIIFTSQQWHTRVIHKGIVWKQAHFDNLFGGEQEINMVEIDLKKHHKRLKLAGISSGTKLTSAFAKENKAMVAINGGFFNTKIGGASDFIKINGEIINATSNKHPRSNAYFVFDKKRSKILRQTQDSLQEITYNNVILSGPLLLLNGKSVAIKNDKFNSNKHPRTAIAIKGNTLIFFTVDGRSKHSHGLNIFEMSKLLSWHKCESAMNLDGGGSTTMYIQGQPYNGIVNYPSDNKLFDHGGERPVANIIYIQN